MSRILIFCMAIWLGGFAAAAATAPDVAPTAVVAGTIGLALTLVCVAVLCGDRDPSTRRRRAPVGGGG